MRNNKKTLLEMIQCKVSAYFKKNFLYKRQSNKLPKSTGAYRVEFVKKANVLTKTNIVIICIFAVLVTMLISFHFKEEATIIAEDRKNFTIDSKEGANSENSIADMIENVSGAIVGVIKLREGERYFLKQEQNIEEGTGSGIVFKKTGNKAFIVTNFHVIDGATNVEVSLSNGERERATIVGADPLTDLAVLKISAENVTTVATFGNSDSLRIGDQVLAIGNPLGLDLSRTVTKGIISGLERTIPISTTTGLWELTVLQTDAAINPGNSGGALINKVGEVIGINSLKISRNGVEGIGFAIPISDVLPIVKQLMATGKVKRPYIGVSLIDINELHPTYRANLTNEITSGALITNIENKSAADRAHLAVEDVIVAINDEPVKSVSHLRKYLYEQVNPHEEIKLSIYRDNKLMFININIDEMR